MEQKILILKEVLRSENSIEEIFEKYAMTQVQFNKWNEELLEGGTMDSSEGITHETISKLKQENTRLKELVADLVLRYDIMKKR